MPLLTLLPASADLEENDEKMVGISFLCHRSTLNAHAAKTIVFWEQRSFRATFTCKETVKSHLVLIQ
jgi:hypothetical protein